MAHYAWINADNIVINVSVGVDENVTHSDNGTPVGGSTEGWEQFYTASINQEGVYAKRTSYNHNIRKQFATVGSTYDSVADVFVYPSPFPSWTLDSNHDWQPPIPFPADDNYYEWNETTLNWVLVNID